MFLVNCNLYCFPLPNFTQYAATVIKAHIFCIFLQHNFNLVVTLLNPAIFYGYGCYFLELIESSVKSLARFMTEKNIKKKGAFILPASSSAACAQMAC